MALADLLRVRYLHSEAVRYMRTRHPLSAGLAVSLMQDAVEALCAEAVKVCGGTKQAKVEFLQHWDIVAAQGQGKTLPYLDEMKRLNRARVNFKHHGQCPTFGDCEKYAAEAHLFLVETCSAFFDRPFTSISEADLITSDEMRAAMKAAEAAHAEGNYEDALNRCADLNVLLETTLAQYLPVDATQFAPSLRGADSDAVQVVEWLDKRIATLAASLRHISIGLAPGEYALLKRVLPMRNNPGTRYLRTGMYQTPSEPGAREAIRILLRAVISTEVYVASTEAAFLALQPTPASAK